MPVYTYECEECGVRFDTRQKFSDDPITECPECGGHTHRVPQPVGIVFKGSGWYVKDSQGKNNLAVSSTKDGESDNGNGKHEAKADAKSEAKSETKSESKVETKSETKSESSSSKSDTSPKKAD